MIDRLHDALETRLASRRGFLTVVGVSFLESTFIAIPIEALVLPTMATNAKRAVWMALAMLIGCLAGSALFYAGAALLFDPVIAPLLEHAGWRDDFDRFTDQLEGDGFLALFLVGITPVPLQIGTLGAGFAGYPVTLFLLAMLLSRGIRYFGLALLAYILGRSAPEFIQTHQAKIVVFGTLLTLALYAVYAAIKFWMA